MRLRFGITAALAAFGAAVFFAVPAHALDEISFGLNWVPEAEQGGFEIQPLPQPARLDCLLAIIEVSNGDEGRALPRAWHRTPSPWSRR